MAKDSVPRHDAGRVSPPPDGDGLEGNRLRHQIDDDLGPLANVQGARLPKSRVQVGLGDDIPDPRAEHSYGDIHRGSYLTDDEIYDGLAHPTQLPQDGAEPPSTERPQSPPAGRREGADAAPPAPPPLSSISRDWLGDDIIDGSGGDDTLWGGDGADTLGGGSGEDSLIGGAGDDIIAGDGDNDVAWGGDGNDTLSGGTGDDTLYGESGDDRLYGDGGDDVFYGGAGDGGADGGGGDDLFIFGVGSGNDHFDGGSGWADTIRLEGIEVGPDSGVWTLDVEDGVQWAETETGLVFDEPASGQIALDDGSTLTFEGVSEINWG